MEAINLLWLFAGGLLAGMINVMAGGAGFMTFPLLIATGLSEMEANACNFVALLPANLVGTWVYRHELREVREHLPHAAGARSRGWHRGLAAFRPLG